MTQQTRSFKIVSGLIDFIHQRGYELEEHLPSERDLMTRFDVEQALISSHTGRVEEHFLKNIAETQRRESDG